LYVDCFARFARAIAAAREAGRLNFVFLSFETNVAAAFAGFGICGIAGVDVVSALCGSSKESVSGSNVN
jgi:hypothetical protein